MKRCLVVGMTVLSIGLLTACGRASLPYAREMGDMALMRTMGIDMEGEQMAVTISTGRRAVGLKGDTEPPLIMSSTQSSISEACFVMQGMSDSYLFYGYVDQFILGETAVQAGIFPVLDYLARNVELGLGTKLWATREMSAKTAIETGGEEGLEQKLSILQTDNEIGVVGLTPTAMEVFQAILEHGSAYLPVLELVQQGEEQRLIEAGYAVLKEDHLQGYLYGEQARGLELLEGRDVSDILQVQWGQKHAVVQITGASNAYAPKYENGELKELQLHCRIAAELLEFESPIQQEDVDQIQKIVEQEEQKRMELTLQRLQDWGTDCVTVGSQVEMAAPEGWVRIEQDWERIFQEIPVEVTVQVTISRAFGDLA